MDPDNTSFKRLNLNKENLTDKIWDESEICSQKIYCLHGTSTPHGKVIIWYSELEAKRGTPKQKSNYLNGQPHGWHKEYYPNGNLKVKVRFQNGQQVTSPEVWTEDGIRQN